MGQARHLQLLVGGTASVRQGGRLEGVLMRTDRIDRTDRAAAVFRGAPAGVRQVHQHGDTSASTGPYG